MSLVSFFLPPIRLLLCRPRAFEVPAAKEGLAADEAAAAEEEEELLEAAAAPAPAQTRTREHDKNGSRRQGDE
jgi:hypothetical protein